MVKVSAIIPAYNIEEYIDRCIESILNQSLVDFEIIIVNDGSTDLTRVKIERKIKKDNRIRLINSINCGAIEARKKGLREAKGEYIFFIDGDDWLELSAFEELYFIAQKGEFDIVCFDSIKTDGKKYKIPQKYKAFDTRESDDYLELLLSGKISGSLWSKFIKRSFIVSYIEKFPNNSSYAEDFAVSVMLGCYNPIACGVNNTYYNYFYREESTTNNFSKDISEDLDKMLYYMENCLKENLIYEAYKEVYEYMSFLHGYFYVGDRIFKSKKGKKIYNNWKKRNIDISKNLYIREMLANLNTISQITIKFIERYYLVGKLFYLLKKKG